MSRIKSTRTNSRKTPNRNIYEPRGPGLRLNIVNIVDKLNKHDETTPLKRRRCTEKRQPKLDRKTFLSGNIYNKQRFKFYIREKLPTKNITYLCAQIVTV